MIMDTEAFNAVVQNVGGLYQVTGAPNELEQRLIRLFGWPAQHVELIGSEANCKFRPDYGMIRNREFNAVAFRNFHGTPCIGVYSGALQALNGLFCRIASRGNKLLELETIDVEHEQQYLADNYLEVLTDPAVLQREPKSKTGQVWADACTKQALRFLIRHEMVHLAHGHVDYLAASQGYQVFAELRWDIGIDIATFERQVIEFDADSCAASWWCGVFLDEYFAFAGVTDSSSLSDLEIDNLVVTHLWHVFFQWAFSVSALFRLFGDAGFAGQDLKNSDYPPLRLRQVIVLRTVIDHVRTRFNSRLADMIAPAVWKGLEDAEGVPIGDPHEVGVHR